MTSIFIKYYFVDTWEKKIHYYLKSMTFSDAEDSLNLQSIHL